MNDFDNIDIEEENDRIDRAVYKFHMDVHERDMSLRSRLRKSVSLSDVLMIPQVYRLAESLGIDGPDFSSAARVAVLVCDAKGGIRCSLGSWIARAWKANGQGSDWKSSCEGRLDALLHTSDPNLFLGLLRALVPMTDEKVPFGPAAKALMDWSCLESRCQAAQRIACEYAAATMFSR